MNRLGKIFAAAALAVLPMACKDEARNDADKAAENVKEQREDLREQSNELGEALKDTRNADDIVENSKDVAEQVRDLKTAEADFGVRRGNRVASLRVVHSVVSSQPMLINTLGGVTTLTDKARADLAEKMQIFQMRVDEAGNAIESLHTADANGFETANDAAAQAMERLEDARENAWEALNDGDRIEAS
ncbi:MAG: hypothetical protein M4D80_28215 [Myxococcota bacterium]|nr:hypothetical protein [Deltaproteobacteria bacterium]MDQ3339063.1 hypothetical protein [Myxococcota bacterium]